MISPGAPGRSWLLLCAPGALLVCSWVLLCAPGRPAGRIEDRALDLAWALDPAWVPGLMESVMDPSGDLSWRSCAAGVDGIGDGFIRRFQLG